VATLHERAPSTGTGSAKRSLQRSVTVRWKDGVIRRKVRFRDFEPTGALNLPKRFLPSLAVGTIAPSATCPNLRMVRSGSNKASKRDRVDVSLPPGYGTPAKVRPMPTSDVHSAPDQRLRRLKLPRAGLIVRPQTEFICSEAHTAACVRLATLTFRRIALMWTLTLGSAIPSSCAISLLEAPRVRQCRI
jgi:hypothetical protein